MRKKIQAQMFQVQIEEMKKERDAALKLVKRLEGEIEYANTMFDDLNIPRQTTDGMSLTLGGRLSEFRNRQRKLTKLSTE